LIAVRGIGNFLLEEILPNRAYDPPKFINLAEVLFSAFLHLIG
jgi:hypothetical protein